MQRMIYTLTVNPSLDYLMEVEDFAGGKVNRAKKTWMGAGGKGVNVSIVLKNLGVKSRALGFKAGFTGDEIERLIREQGIPVDFIPLSEGLSRINVKLHGKTETEINAPGPIINAEEKNLLEKKIASLSSGDTLVIAGSLPPSLPEDFYSSLMKSLNGKNVPCVVDTTGPSLEKTLEYRPFLIKPNNFELGALFNRELSTREDVVPYAKILQERGAENVLVSLGGEGAVLVCKDGRVMKASSPHGKVVNSVGAGDSMVAGFLAAYNSTEDFEKAFVYGIAAGSGSAFKGGLAGKEDLESLVPQIHID